MSSCIVVDGEWSIWSEWGVCNITCGGGYQNRNRTCALPAHGGEKCAGSPLEVQSCNALPCEGKLIAYGNNTNLLVKNIALRITRDE